MRSKQMTFASHEATPLIEEDLDDETLVLTFEETQKWKIVSNFENVKNVHTLGEYIDDDREVQSVMGQPLQAYGSNFELLQELINKLEQKLNAEAKKI